MRAGNYLISSLGKQGRSPDFHDAYIPTLVDFNLPM